MLELHEVHVCGNELVMEVIHASLTHLQIHGSCRSTESQTEKEKCLEYFYTSGELYFHMKVSVLFLFFSQHCIIKAENVVVACLYHWVVCSPHCCNHCTYILPL